jgi:hypothetical protein
MAAAPRTWSTPMKALHGLELKFGYLRLEHERRSQRQNPEAG